MEISLLSADDKNDIICRLDILAEKERHRIAGLGS
jgi:hypothetical protein